MWIGQASLDDARNSKMHPRNVIAGEAVLLPQGQHAVDAGGDARRRRMGFDQPVHEMKALAETLRDDRRSPAVRASAGKAAAAFENVGPSAGAGMREQRGSNTAVGGVHGLHSFTRPA